MQCGGFRKEIQETHQGSRRQKPENRAARRAYPRASNRAQVNAAAAGADRHGRACDPERTHRILMADNRKELKDGKGRQRVTEGSEQWGA